MPKRKKEVVRVTMEPGLNRKLKEVSQATGLNRDAIIRWAIVKELPGIEASELRAETQTFGWNETGRSALRWECVNDVP